MMSLIWKDLRLNRLLLITAAIGLFAPYAVILTTRAVNAARHDTFTPIEQDVALAGMFSLLISILLMSVLAGNAFAGERADRSAEFLAILPASRLRLLASKLAVSLPAAAAFWIVNLVVLFVVVPRLAARPMGVPDNLPTVVAMFGASAASAFGTAWFASALASNAGIPSALGILAPVVLAGLTSLWVRPGEEATRAFEWAAGAVAVLGLVIGSIVYIRREEP
ncbi:ABC-2 family transporter protein [Phycisphaerae bacterium RAS1]|nr:ABC-2 family transporter protein [Phycisphaerae bacterium RAS1]